MVQRRLRVEPVVAAAEVEVVVQWELHLPGARCLQHLQRRQEVLHRQDEALVAALPQPRETRTALPIGPEMRAIRPELSSWPAATLSAWMRKPGSLIRHSEKAAW